MLSPKLVPKTKQKYPQRQNNLNKPQLVIAIQQKVDVHAKLKRALTQNLINLDSKELPPGK
jgi:hypothetical protein